MPAPTVLSVCRIIIIYLVSVLSEADDNFSFYYNVKLLLDIEMENLLIKSLSKK